MSNDTTFNINIRANADGTLTAFRSASQGVNSIQRGADNASSAVDRLSANIARVGRYSAGLVGFGLLGQQAKSVISLADSMTSLQSRIKLAANSQQDYIKANAQLLQISLSTGSALASNADVFSKLNKTVIANGGSMADTLKMTQLVAQSLTISGAAASESAATIKQFGQALASGVLRGDEFNSIMENAPRLADALALSLGKTKGELRAMAEAGQLSASTVTAALLVQSDSINKEFSKMPLTVARAMENLHSSFSVWISDLNTSTNATGGFAQGINSMALNFGTLAKMLGIAAGAALGYAAALSVQQLSAFVAAQQLAIQVSAAHGAALLMDAQRTAMLATANVAAATAARTNAIATANLSGALAATAALTAAQTAETAALAAVQTAAAGSGTLLSRALLAVRSGMTALLAINPFTAIITALAAAATAAYVYRDELISLGESNATVGQYIEATWITIRNSTTDALDGISLSFSGVEAESKKTTVSISSVFSDTWRIIKNLGVIAFNGLVDSFKAVGITLGVGAAGIVEVVRQQFSKIAAMGSGLAGDMQAALKGDFSFKGISAAFAQDTLGMKQVAADIATSLSGLFKTDYLADFGVAVQSQATQLNSLQTQIDANANITQASGAAVVQAISDTAAATQSLNSETLKDRKSSLDDALAHLKAVSDQEVQVITGKIQAIDRLYEQGGISVSAYFSGKAALITQQFDTEADGIRKQIALIGNELKDLQSSTPRLDIKVNTSNITNDIKAAINAAASKYNVPSSLITGLISHESNFKADAMPPINKETGKRASSAKGLMQLVDGTAREMGYSPQDMFNVANNIDAGTHYLAIQLQKAGGDVRKALAAYYAGWGNLNQNNAVAKTGLNSYAPDIIARQQKYAGGAGFSATAADPKAIAESGKLANDLAQKQIGLQTQLAGLEAKKTAALSDNTQQLYKLADAQKIADPTEQYNRSIDLLKQIQATPAALNNDQYAAKLSALGDALLKDTQLVQQFGDAQSLLQTPVQKLQADIAQLNAAYALGGGNLDAYNAKLQSLMDTFNSSDESTQAFNSVMQSLDKSILEATGSQLDIFKEQIKAVTNPEQYQQALDKFQLKIDTEAFKVQIDSLKSSLKSALGSMLDGTKSFGEAFKDIFNSMVSQVLNTSINNLVDGLASALRGGSWSQALGGLVGVAVSGITALLSKSVPATSPSVAQQVNNQNVYGATQMAIADQAARAVFSGSTLESIQSWNNAVNTATSLLRSNMDAIAGWASNLLSTVVNDIFGTGLANAWASVTNYVSSAYQSLASMGSELLGGVKGMVTTAANYLTSLGTTTTSTIGTTAATTGATAGESSLGALTAYAGAALSILQLGYNLYEIAGQKYTTVIEKISQSLGAAALAAGAVSIAVGVAAAGIGAGASAIFAAIPVVGWIVAAALQAASVVMEGLGGDLSRSFANGFGGHLGTFLWDGMNKKDPTATMLSMTSPDTRANKVQDSAGDYYTSSGGKSGSVGGDTPFGQLWFRLNDITRKSGLAIEEATKAFLPLIRTVTIFDNALASTIRAVDQVYGEDTLSKFKMAKEYEQPLSNMDSSKFISQRLTDIANGLGETGTKAGEAVAVWWNAFSTKMLDPAKGTQYNTTTALNIETFIAAQLPKLVELPTKLADLFVASVKSVADGATQAQFEGQMNDFFAGWSFAKEGLAKIGIEINDTALPDYLTSLTGLGMTVKDSAVALVAYSNTFDAAAGDVTNKFNNAFNKIFADAKAKGATSDQTSGYISSYVTLSNVAKDAKLSATPEQLDIAATSLNNLALASTQSARAVVDQAIATANLGAMSRDAAIQQLSLTGKLTADQIAAENFTKALSIQQSVMLQGIDFAQQQAVFFSTTISNMGLSFTDVSNIGANLINTFKDMAEAANFLDSVYKAAFSPADYANNKKSQAQATFDAAQKALGRTGGVDTATSYVTSGKYTEDLASAIAKNDTARAGALKNLGQSYVQLTTAETNYQSAIQSSTQAIGSATNDTVNKVQALADAQKQVNDRLRELSSTDIQNQIQAVTDKIAAMIKAAADNGGALTGLDSLQNAELRGIFKPTLDELANIGKTDYAKNLAGINKWADDMIAVAPQIAAAYDVTTSQALSGIQAVSDARIKQLNTERDQIISNNNVAFARAGNSDFEKSLWTIRDNFVSQITAAAANGVAYDDLITIAANGAIEAGKTLKDAQTSLANTIKDKSDSIADKIAALQGKDVGEIQRQRALSDLKTDDFNKQMAAIETLTNLESAKADSAIGNAKKLRDYLDSSLTGAISPLTQTQQFTEAQNQFYKNLAGAKAGNQDSFDKLTSSFDDYAQKGLALSANRQDYTRGFIKARNELEALAGTSTDEKAKLASIQQVAELQNLQSKLVEINKTQTDALSAAFGKVGKDFIDTLQNMAGPTKDVQFDISYKIVSTAVAAATEAFKNSVIATLSAGTLSEADFKTVESISKGFINSLSDLYIAGKINKAETGALLDAKTGIINSLSEVVNAQIITSSAAVAVFTDSATLFEHLRQAVNSGIISGEAMTVVQTAHDRLISSLSSALLAGTISVKSAGDILNLSKDFDHSILTALQKGTVSADSAGDLYKSSQSMINAAMTAIKAGTASKSDIALVTSALSTFSTTTSNQIASLKLSPADSQLYTGALSVMATTIGSAIASNNFSANDLAVLVMGLEGYAKNPAGVLSALNFSQSDLDVIKNALSAAAGNPAEVFKILGFSEADRARLSGGLTGLSANAGDALGKTTPGSEALAIVNQGVTQLATNMQTGLSDVTWLKEPGDVVRGGVNQLAGNIGYGLATVSIDNSPINGAVGYLMSSIASQVASAQSQASTIIANAQVQARAGVISQFDALVNAGSYDAAASLGRNNGYSATEMAQRVAEIGGNYDNAMSFLKLKGYASGGRPDGDYYIAGENGKELIVNGGSDFVYNADQTRGMFKGGGGIGGGGSGDDEALRREMQQLREQMAAADRENKQMQQDIAAHLREIRFYAQKNDVVGAPPVRAA